MFSRSSSKAEAKRLNRSRADVINPDVDINSASIPEQLPSRPPLTHQKSERPPPPIVETPPTSAPLTQTLSRNSIFSAPSASYRPPEQSDAPTSRFSVTSLDSSGVESGADTSFAGDSSQAGSRITSSTWLQAGPHCDLKASASIRSRRNWDEFEGKPISPLPSPAVHHEQGRDMFDLPINSKKTSADSYRDSSMIGTLEPGSKNWSIFGNTSSSPVADARPPRIRTTDLSPAAYDSNSSEVTTPVNFSGPSSSLEQPSNSVRAASADLSSKAHMLSRHPEPTNNNSSGRAVSSRFPSTQAFGLPRHVRISSGESFQSNEPLYSPTGVFDPSTSTSSSLFNLNSTSQMSLSGISDVPSATYDGLPHNVLWAAGSPQRRRPSNVTLDDDRSLNSSPASSIPQKTDLRLWKDAGETSLESAQRPSAVPSPSLVDLDGKGRTRRGQGPSESATGSSLNHSRRSPILEQWEEEEEGDRIGPYRIEKTLGVGAFSRVALGRLVSQLRLVTRTSDRRNSSLHQLQQRTRSKHRSTPFLDPASPEEIVALKMLDREPCDQNQRLKVSWIREVEVLKHISHPNLIRFITSFSTPLHHTLVLEQVPGGELFEALMTHFDQFAEREWLVRAIYSELANAVGWMHQVNLVHRDIKLENILMSTNLFELAAGDPLRPHHLPISGPLVKLTDFGLSRFIDPSNPLLETRCGSEEYAAPELIIGKRYDGRKTDSWALGVVLYALITGSLPFMEDVVVGVNGAREGHGEDRDPKQRKRHLLRIAKGDLRWPAVSNEACLDRTDPTVCPANLRLVTPPAKAVVARLLRRDATKRATPWDTWDEPWLLCGSFGQISTPNSVMTVYSHHQYPNESSAGGEPLNLHPDPRSQEGQNWLDANAAIQHDDLSQLACDD